MGTLFWATNGRRAVPARWAGLAVATLLLAACEGIPPRPVPQAIRSAPPGDLQLVEARQQLDRHLGAPVRWGGTVLQVERDESGNVRVEVLERRLDDDGRPIPGSPSDGRFVVFATPSVDPELYRRGSDVTVAGALDAAVQGRVGERREELPVVRVQEFVRWEPQWYPDPYLDPWYGPRVRFGVGISNLHHHGPAFGYGDPLWYPW